MIITKFYFNVLNSSIILLSQRIIIHCYKMNRSYGTLTLISFIIATNYYPLLQDESFLRNFDVNIIYHCNELLSIAAR